MPLLKNNALYVIIAIVVLVVVYFGYSKTTLELYYLPSCKYCKDLMPVWGQLETSFGNDINIIKINCSDDPAAAEKYNIDRFPTILIHSKFKTHIYNGARNFDAMSDFIQNA